MSLGMICSCHKQDSSAEQEFTQRKAELDGREQALGERVNGLEERMNELDKRMSALAEREIRNADVTTPAAQPQPVIRDPAQVQPEVDSGIQPTPAEAHGLIGDPLQSDPEKAERKIRRENFI